MRLEVKNVHFTYMQGTPIAQRALRDVSLSIDQGEFLGIIGPTGSGKSTLIQHLNGLLLPTAGKVLADGQDISKRNFDLRELRQKVGLLFQFAEQQLFEETVLADIAFGPRNIGVAESEISGRVRESMDAVGLDFSLRDRSPFTLSGGEMRRVAMAGVLAMRPQILVLDEPLAGLDTQGKELVLSQLVGLHKEKGLTIVLVTHDIDTLASLATRIAVLSEGKVVLDGKPEYVFAQEGLLTEIGLDVPQLSKIMGSLRACHWRVPSFVRGAEEAADLIYACWEKTCP
jgi:energy-coupling factor transport system ATP-binding protein